MSFSVHQIKDSVEEFRAMLALFAEGFEDAETYLSNPPSTAYILARLADEGFFALTAKEGEETVGALAAYELQKFEQERSEIYIYDLAASSSHRRKGVATALIARLQQIALTRGAYVIFVQADHGDDPAIALYESLGLREEVLHFDIDPGGK